MEVCQVWLVARLMHVEVEVVIEGVVPVDAVEVVVPVVGDVVVVGVGVLGVEVHQLVIVDDVQGTCRR